MIMRYSPQSGLASQEIPHGMMSILPLKNISVRLTNSEKIIQAISMIDFYKKKHDVYSSYLIELFARSDYSDAEDSITTNHYEAFAGDINDNSFIQIKCIADDKSIKKIRYRVIGCPYLMASLEWLCENLENKYINDIEKITLIDLMEILKIPSDRRSIILLLEDAVNDIRLQLIKKTT